MSIKIGTVHGYLDSFSEGAIFSKKKRGRRISLLAGQAPFGEFVDARTGARFFTALRFVQNDIILFFERLLKIKIKFALLMVLCLAAPLNGQSSDSQSANIKSFTEPYRSIDVAANEMGTLSEVSVSEGDCVTAGTVLAMLNNQVLEASKAIAADTRDAKGKLNSALTELKIQQDRRAKIQGLFDRRHASQSEIDRVEGQLEIAQAQLETVQDELHIRGLEIIRIEAQIEQRRLRSPIDGIVTEVFKNKGEFVSANDPNVVTVVQLNPLLAVFMVPHDQADGFKPDQQVELRIGNENLAIQGIVEFVSPTADAQSGTRRVKVKIANPEFNIPSGQVCYLNPDRGTEIAKSQTGTKKIISTSARK